MRPLGSYTDQELKQLEGNAARLSKDGNEKQKSEALEFLEKIAVEKGSRRPQKRKSQTGFDWDNSDRGHRKGFYKGHKVAEIKKDENHNASNNEVYTVLIGGQRFHKRFKHVEDARKVAEDEVIRTLDARQSPEQ